jgi:hypothetical protein
MTFGKVMSMVYHNVLYVDPSNVIESSVMMNSGFRLCEKFPRIPVDVLTGCARKVNVSRLVLHTTGRTTGARTDCNVCASTEPCSRKLMSGCRVLCISGDAVRYESAMSPLRNRTKDL